MTLTGPVHAINKDYPSVFSSPQSSSAHACPSFQTPHKAPSFISSLEKKFCFYLHLANFVEFIYLLYTFFTYFMLCLLVCVLKIHVFDCLLIWKYYGKYSVSSLVSPLPYPCMRANTKCDLIALSERSSAQITKYLVNISILQKRRVDLWLLAGWFPLFLDAG